ncbi:ribonucleotide reductase subunit alpha [Shewanella sp. NR704-98]|uniref:Ribonucleotide reductase subunit alpha n=2 Tax=Shewanella nanhaiensis TaxID=2864872 RepID=A0ABS7E5B8_9GAMM|nr:ribonucleotide reductase subunit alpha [Shewanella nanhaiensis]
MIKMFKELLQMTSEQSAPQRLLFLFADAEATNPKKSKKHQRGTISPVMCVDKLPSELSSFDALVKEADSIAKQWNFVFVASLSGDNGIAPTTEEAEPFLNKMANDIETGNGVGRYVIFDRDENPIQLESHG